MFSALLHVNCWCAVGLVFTQCWVCAVTLLSVTQGCSTVGSNVPTFFFLCVLFKPNNIFAGTLNSSTGLLVSAQTYLNQILSSYLCQVLHEVREHTRFVLFCICLFLLCSFGFTFTHSCQNASNQKINLKPSQVSGHPYLLFVVQKLFYRLCCV